MNRILSLVIPIAMTASMFVACKSGSGTSSSTSGGSSTKPAGTATITKVVQNVGFSALVRAGGLVTPQTAVSNYTVSCQSGNISVNAGGASFTQATNSLTLSGSVTTSFNSCVEDGYTLGGGWSEGFNFTDTFNPSGCLTGGGCTGITMNGSITVGPSTISVHGNGVATASCSLNFSETISNFGYNINTGALSGTLSYSGTICGQSVSGTVTCSGTSCS